MKVGSIMISGRRRQARWLTDPSFALRNVEHNGRAAQPRDAARADRTEKLRRGCLLILGRSERAHRFDGQRESTRRLLAETQRLEHDRRRRPAA